MSRTIYMIVAMGSDRTIAKDGKLPWHLQADIDRYRGIVKDKVIIMGKGDYLSYGDNPFNGRRRIVLTQSDDELRPEVEKAGSFEEALSLAGDEDVYIEGGAGVFASTLEHADVVYLTEIDHAYDGDRFFPELPENEWELVTSVEGEDPDFEHTFWFNTYKRRS